MSIQIIQGDCRTVLPTLGDGSVQCVVTSPPYFGLRSYGIGAENGEIGLEASPDLFIAEMVAVFREVRRVLRDDGTLWLNLGDSYNAYNGGAGPGSKLSQTASAQRPQLETGYGLRTKSLKPKDLLGIPWAVAKALQAPFYVGRVQREIDRVWLAAIIDGEGCIYIARQPVGTITGRGRRSFRTQDSFCAGLAISNTSRLMVDRFAEIIGKENVRTIAASDTRRTHYSISITGSIAKGVLAEVYPYLVAKKHEARIALACGASGDDSLACWAALKHAHKQGSVDFDRPPPNAGSLWEPGWYLRSDIIWHKPNPMPESCNDRPTTSHEHVFLLTKKPKYFYDASAVREEATSADHHERYAAAALGYAKKQPGQRPTGMLGCNPDGRNLRNVWTITTQPYAGSHFATMPAELVERCIKAGTSEKGCCPACGAPWARITTKGEPDEAHRAASGADSTGGYNGQSTKGHDAHGVQNASDVKRRILEGMRLKTYGWQPTCDCPHNAAQTVPCTVLDPFSGAGTTALVADRLNRRAIGIELNPQYATLARNRVIDDAPLFAEVS